MGFSAAGKETVLPGNLKQGRQFRFLVAKKNENTPEYFERSVLNQILVADFKEAGVGIIPVQHFAYGVTGGIFHFEKQSLLLSGARIDGCLVAFESKPPLPPVKPFFRRMTMVKSPRNDHITRVTDHVETPEWHGQRRQIKLAVVLEYNGAGRRCIALPAAEEQSAPMFANLPENIPHPCRARLMVGAHQLEASLLAILCHHAFSLSENGAKTTLRSRCLKINPKGHVGYRHSSDSLLPTPSATLSRPEVDLNVVTRHYCSPLR
jgi:hypothetical protein